MRDRIRCAWQGRITGCLLGKPVEVLSFRTGRAGLSAYLREAGALPLRDYVPLVEGTLVDTLGRACCRGKVRRAEPDDDINYTVVALLLLEQKGLDFDTADVARGWLNLLPAGRIWTAERAAYRTLLDRMDDEFVNGADPGFDIAECSDNDFNEWIGAQIRADVYGWVCPGQPALAASLAARDAALSHRGDGVYAAMFVAALAAAIAVEENIENAIESALQQIPDDCGAATAVRAGHEAAAAADGAARLHRQYAGLSPVHSLNNLALVVWAICSAGGDFSAAIGDVVSAGWDTDSNGATVGGLMGLAGAEIPAHWTRPWAGRIGLDVAGCGELRLEELVTRTLAVARGIETRKAA